MIHQLFFKKRQYIKYTHPASLIIKKDQPYSDRFCNLLVKCLRQETRTSYFEFRL